MQYTILPHVYIPSAKALLIGLQGLGVRLSLAYS
jgi:hypothetical protein